MFFIIINVIVRVKVISIFPETRFKWS